MAATPSRLWRAVHGWHSADRLSVETIRCAHCRALLFRATAGAIAGPVEIKCRRCGTFNVLRPSEPSPERHERPTSGETGCPSNPGPSGRRPSTSATPSKS
ncbi:MULTISPECIES: Com family DNA-binding transcriptional regulator [Rhodoplanes]|uniref:Com family DNA-binding transcriptional regulator n=1 Tax=Rhodoplanes TaxID=29407 RepID=UPI003461EF82